MEDALELSPNVLIEDLLLLDAFDCDAPLDAPADDTADDAFDAVLDEADESAPLDTVDDAAELARQLHA